MVFSPTTWERIARGLFLLFIAANILVTIGLALAGAWARANFQLGVLALMVVVVAVMERLWVVFDAHEAAAVASRDRARAQLAAADAERQFAEHALLEMERQIAAGQPPTIRMNRAH